MISMDVNYTVAIKIPTYNSEATILDTLKSFLNQTYLNFTVYIFDNCSTDNTLKIIESLHDIRIKIIKSEKNYGWAWNFNRCLTATGEEMMLFAHSDDIYHPRFLEINVKLSRIKQNALLFSKGALFKNKIKNYILPAQENTPLQIDEYTSHEVLLNKIITNGNFLFCPTAFGKSEIFSTVICKFNESDFKGSADLDAWLRASKFHPIIVIKKPILFFHRLSNNQISYWDRKDSDNYFVKCIKAYVQDISSINDKIQLSHYIRWHEIFHSVFINIDNENCSKFIHMDLISEVIKSNVNFSKKYKLLGLLITAQIIVLFPINYRKKLNLLLLQIIR
jgi:glycosyltransferase involved in cell wall biosynthesis